MENNIILQTTPISPIIKILPIKGFEGEYEISNTGKVFSLKGKLRKELKLRNGGAGYFTVALCKNGKAKNYYVHHLVAEHFLNNPLKLSEINHKDGSKSNNFDWNLEWTTRLKNMQHAFKNGFINNEGEKKTAKVNNIQVLQMRELYATEQYSFEKLAKIFNLTAATVCRIINRKGWKHI